MRLTTLDGLKCIMKPRDVDHMTADLPQPFLLEDVWMTKREFDALPEFEG